MRREARYVVPPSLRGKGDGDFSGAAAGDELARTDAAHVGVVRVLRPGDRTGYEHTADSWTLSGL
jgi:hypothetical protein